MLFKMQGAENFSSNFIIFYSSCVSQICPLSFQCHFIFLGFKFAVFSSSKILTFSSSLRDVYHFPLVIISFLVSISLLLVFHMFPTFSRLWLTPEWTPFNTPVWLPVLSAIQLITPPSNFVLFQQYWNNVFNCPY